jgi:hypothetical protein
MSDNDFFAEFNGNFGFDDRLLQTGESNTENGYLQNEEALTFFRKKQADWNKILMVNATFSSFGFLGMPLLGIFGCVSALTSIERSRPIDRIVSVMEMLLDEFKEEGITITPRVKTKEGIIDLLVKAYDGRHFAFTLRSNGESKVLWRAERQEFYTVRKGRRSKWSGLEVLGDDLHRMMMCLKEEENLLLGSSKAARKKAFTKAIVFTSKTKLDPNNDPALMVNFGRTTALRMIRESSYYLVDLANLANFIRQPSKK